VDPLREYARLLARLARAIIDKETTTTAGRVNLFGVLAGVLVVFAAGTFDLAQVLIRIGVPDYETGIPSLAITAIWAGVFLFCVLILSLLDRQE
jgi:hypothetical protein